MAIDKASTVLQRSFSSTVGHYMTIPVTSLLNLPTKLKLCYLSVADRLKKFREPSTDSGKKQMSSSVTERASENEPGTEAVATTAAGGASEPLNVQRTSRTTARSADARPAGSRPPRARSPWPVAPPQPRQIRPLCWILYFCTCTCCCTETMPVTVSKKDKNKKPTKKSKKTDLPKHDCESYTLDDIRSWGSSFDKLMHSPAGRKIFRDFLRMEYSEENILFWLACEELKKEENPEVVEEMARIIYEDYISILSPKEVSLDAQVRDIVNRNMVKPTPHTFDEAQFQIYTLMHRDSYPRFINSAYYKSLPRRFTKGSRGQAIPID